MDLVFRLSGMVMVDGAVRYVTVIKCWHASEGSKAGARRVTGVTRGVFQSIKMSNGQDTEQRPPITKELLKWISREYFGKPPSHADGMLNPLAKVSYERFIVLCP